MKRYAVLLGHMDGQLSTPLDISRMKKFLMGDKGGAWFESEIYSKTNISRAELLTLLAKIKKAAYDYLFFYFSGHGGYKRGTVLYLNPKEEIIEERALSKLATRQLNIYDCCRARDDAMAESTECIKLFSAEKKYVTLIRREYENRIMTALSQQMSLYSCSIEEYSYDFGNGGVYTTHLIEATAQFSNDFLLVSQAHDVAYRLTIDEAKNHGVNQNPDYFMPKYSSAQQLIFAINDVHLRF